MSTETSSSQTETSSTLSQTEASSSSSSQTSSSTSSTSSSSSTSSTSSSSSSSSYPLIDNIIRKALLEDSSDFKMEEVSIEKEIDIRSGDIILFNRPCVAMQPMASFICYAAKITALSQFDHVGIVVECTDHKNDKFQYGDLYLLEANMGGVTLYPLLDRLSKSKAKVIAIRKLKERNYDIINLELKNKLWEIALSSIGMKYDPSIITMSKALLASYYSHGRNSRINRLKDIDDMVELLRSHQYSNPYLQNLVNLRIEQLQKDKLSIPNQPTDDNKKTDKKTKYFCSSLVAETLRQSGIKQHDDRDISLFIPSDFSSQSYFKGFHTNPLFTYDKNVSLFKDGNRITFKKDNGVLKIYTNKEILREENSDKEKLVKEVLMGVLTACPNTFHPPVVTSATKITKKTLTCALRTTSLEIDEGQNLNPNEIINEMNITKNLSYGIILLPSIKRLTKLL